MITLLISAIIASSPQPRVLNDDIDNTYHPRPAGSLPAHVVGPKEPVQPANKNNRSGLSDGTNPGSSTQNNGGTANPAGTAGTAAKATSNKKK